MPNRSTLAGAAVLVLVGLAGGLVALRRYSSAPLRHSPTPPATAGNTAPHPGLLYGRVTTIDGGVYQGRLRWGGGEEACWGDYFSGTRKANPWASYVPPGRLPVVRSPFAVFGIEFGQRETPLDLRRIFMARFGDLTRIEPRGRDVLVTLKSGSVVELDRYSASDFDDGVRVWDETHGVTSLDSRIIRLIELLPAPPAGGDPGLLHGTVRTLDGAFTGLLQWEREQRLGSDAFIAVTEKGDLQLHFDTVRSIERQSSGRLLLTRRDGSAVEFAHPREGNARGIYVDDPRYGRVLVSRSAFVRVDFSPGGGGPAYRDFPAGTPLQGTVVTRAGRRLAGRLVFDLDENESIETLDAPSKGVNYTIPFGLVASISLPEGGERVSRSATVTLHSGEQLLLECAGDLGDANAGLLVFAGGDPLPSYVRWSEVAQILLARPMEVGQAR